jgi:integrase
MARKNARRTRPHRPWNKGKSVGQKRPFTPEQVQLIKRTLDADGNLRDLALFSTAIDTMLRSVDLLRLTVEDVTDDAGHVVDETTIRQQKTGEANVVGISDYTRKVLGRWIIDSKKLPDDHLFTRLKGDKRKPLTRDHYRLGSHRARRSTCLQHALAAANKGGLYLRADPQHRGHQGATWPEVSPGHQCLSQRRQEEGAGDRAKV